MRILFLSISYNDKKKNIYTDLVEELIKNDHQITIVSADTNQYINKLNYTLIGFRENIISNKNFLKKGINTLFIGEKFKNIIKRQLKNDSFDLILYATPPVTLNGAIKYCKKTYSARSYLMLKDIFPQNAVDLKMMTKLNPIYWYFRIEEKKLYNISDFIGCMSEGNVKYLLENNKYLSPSKVGIFYNSIKIKDIKINNSYRKETIFLFGGNLGKPQNIEGILKIIDLLKDYNLAKFIIVGTGSETKKIISYVNKEKNNNLIYFDFVSRNKYEDILKNADVGIISLDPRFTIPNIPSKLPTYMNLKKPVLAFTDEVTDLKDIIADANCGWWVQANRIDKIISQIKYICEHKNEQIDKGYNGFKYLISNFNVEKNVKQLESFMLDKI